MPPRRGHRTLPDLSVGSEKKYGCRFCGHRDHNKDDIEAHERSHHTGQRLQCEKPGCNFSAWSKADIRRHDKKEHQRLAYQCPWCQQAQNPRSDNLRNRHMPQCPQREGRDPKTAKLNRVEAEGSNSGPASFSSSSSPSAATYQSGSTSSSNSNSGNFPDLSPYEESAGALSDPFSEFAPPTEEEFELECQRQQLLLLQEAVYQDTASDEYPAFDDAGGMQQEQQDLQMDEMFDFVAASSDPLSSVFSATEQHELSEYMLPQIGSWQLDEYGQQQQWPLALLKTSDGTMFI